MEDREIDSVETATERTAEATDIARAMAGVIDKWRDIAVDVPSHRARDLSGHPVAWWFNRANSTTSQLMAALASDSKYVVPGKPDQSRLVTDFLRDDRLMGQRLGQDAAIIRQWIQAGCPALKLLETDSDQPGANDGPGKPISVSEGTSGATGLKLTRPEQFHLLINIERNPDFLLTAAQLAVQFFKVDDKFKNNFSRFEYSEHAFDDRMLKIYNDDLPGMYDPEQLESGIIKYPIAKDVERKYNVGRFSNRAVKERFKQFAPFNLIDGAWLQHILSVGPSDSVKSKLFAIWDDEAGNGKVEQNHSNVYSDLLHSLNIYLPSIRTGEFIEQDFLDGAFEQPVFQLCVGLFPERFFPELLGMTLYLEWEATPTLTPIVRLLEARHYNSHFYRLHVAIDNVSSGHGAIAKEAIKLYLAEQKEQGGDDALQEQWKRIWNGYVTWATMGDVGIRIIERYLAIDKKQINISTDPKNPKCIPDINAFCHDQMVRLIKFKAPIASQIHRGKVLGGKPLSSLFSQPEELMRLLVKEGFVDPNHPRGSRFLQLTAFDGPMYKVFTQDELDVIVDWIESLRKPKYPCIDPMSETPTPGDWPAKMAKLIRDHAAAGQNAHEGIQLPGPDGVPVPLASLFERPRELMASLIRGGWVVPKHPDRSMFLTRIVTNGGPMQGVLTDPEVAVVTEWIRSGAELPSSQRAFLELLDVDPRRGLSRQLIGMGAVH